MLENQSFQSLLQLAVALNFAYAAISTIYGNSVSREKLKIDAVVESAVLLRTIGAADDAATKKFRGLLATAVELRNEVNAELVDIENLFYSVLRYLAIASALISLGLLYYTSFYATDDAAGWLYIVSVVTHIPFIGFVIYSTGRSLLKSGPLRDKRIELDKKVAEGLASAVLTTDATPS